MQSGARVIWAYKMNDEKGRNVPVLSEEVIRVYFVG